MRKTCAGQTVIFMMLKREKERKKESEFLGERDFVVLCVCERERERELREKQRAVFLEKRNESGRCRD